MCEGRTKGSSNLKVCEAQTPGEGLGRFVQGSDWWVDVERFWIDFRVLDGEATDIKVLGVGWDVVD